MIELQIIGSYHELNFVITSWNPTGTGRSSKQRFGNWFTICDAFLVVSSEGEHGRLALLFTKERGLRDFRDWWDS